MPYPRLTMSTRIRARDLLRAESSSAKITAPWTVKRKIHKENVYDVRLKGRTYISTTKHTHREADISNKRTVVSFVADALHAEDDDGSDPELDPQQISPITGAPEEPQSAEQHVHDAHQHEELTATRERKDVIPDDEGKEKFKKSGDVAFYRRQMEGPNLQHRALLDTLVLTERGARFELLEPDTQTRLLLSVSPCRNDTVRILIDEMEPIKARYRVPDVITGELQCERRHQIRVWHFPFRLEILCEDKVMVTFNSRSKLWFETLQDPTRRGCEGSHKRTHYGKRRPSSVGSDLSLHGFSHVFGLPEHADGLQLRDTSPASASTAPCRWSWRTNNRTLGVFWLNASETFVNVHYSSSDHQIPSLKRRRREPQTDVHWLSESGLIDCLVLLGPGPQQVFKQYAQLTGCRWNYNDEADVRAVDAGFDHHDIPYDAIWLDIEHTDGKRYFTWDPVTFPNPSGLQRHLEDKKRKLVVISDPHIKVDPDWSMYREARDGGHFVKNRDGEIYRGSCWPGESSYLDFSRADTRAWYSRCFGLDKYKGSTSSLFVWNDMNEPSVFDGPEQTMPKDAHMATADGLITRSGGLERPFILTRSFFAGSQRFADVGGFVQNPDPELLVRWYQAAALQPFFRGHSAKETKRREPWLFGEEVTDRIRTAITQRYCLLPYWYTLFHQAHTCGLPPSGGALLACPVTEAQVKEVKVLLPGSNEVWYDVHSAEEFKGGRTLSLPVTLDTGLADGELYLDDGHSFRFRDRKSFSRRRFSFRSDRLICRAAGEGETFECDTVVQKLTVLGLKRKPSSVIVHVSGAEDVSAAFEFLESCSTLTVKDLELRVLTDWEIQMC
ncbi:hypothetical protein F7725_008577 [Dissostichus mawsoni]|uniref:Uncharacterized protein n=1 Tax=Dissostichus mawsoni TaxID=36200 RepID=A0A7J5Y7K1_DISMA|nr:hypothetical protein F7725_008577 [Dissostichus mawsoni]